MPRLQQINPLENFQPNLKMGHHPPPPFYKNPRISPRSNRSADLIMNKSEYSSPPNLDFKGMNRMKHFQRNRVIDFSSSFIRPDTLSQRRANSANLLNNGFQNSPHPTVGPQQLHTEGQFGDRTSSTSSPQRTLSDIISSMN